MAEKDFKSLARRTKASNEKYKTASRAEKRVMIAKDVIRAIEAKQIIPTHGDYFSVDVDYDKRPRDEESLKELLPTLPACNVCAKGAILLCSVARQNKVTFGEADDWSLFSDHTLSRALGGVFTPKQLGLIEDAFEGIDDQDQADKTLTAVMKNVVKNKGTFVPEKAEATGGGCSCDLCR